MLAQLAGRQVLGSSLALLLTLAGCRTPNSSSALAANAGPGALPLSLEHIDTVQQFVAASKDASGIVKTGRTLKFFVDLRTAGQPKVHFVNGNFLVNGATPEYAQFHYYFARKTLGLTEGLDEFNNVTYFTENKRYMAGTLQTYDLDGTGELTYGVSLYPQDVIHGIKTLEAVKIVAGAIKIPAVKFAFVESGSQQTTDDVASEYTQAGIARLSIEKILGSINYIPMHQGEAFGYLRFFPSSQDNLTAADIVVFDDLPLDLTVVAATITRAYQDTNSHVNLKSKERNTPNAVLRDASPDQGKISAFKDQPVHLVVGPENFTIEPTTPEIIAQKLKERFSKPWVPITWDVTTKLLSYDSMCPTAPGDCLKLGRKYGSKAANLGFLANRKVLGRKAVPGTLSQKMGYDLVPTGFGIPLQLYKAFVDLPANAALKKKLAELITREKSGVLSGDDRKQLIAQVQQLFYDGVFPPNVLTQIQQRVASDLVGIEKVKIRSSANAEDIAGFDGAGLHDSYSAEPAKTDNPEHHCTKVSDDAEGGGGETKAKMKPKTLACAIKGVYASLWNKRAIEERSFSRIDHSTVSMGISVLPAYDFQSPVTANSVVVTRVLNTEDVYGYSLSIQQGNNLVTNPDPGTFTEATIAAIGTGTEPTSLTVTRFAKPKKDEPQLSQPVLVRDQTLNLVKISQTVEEAYCRARPDYYADDCGFVSVDVRKPKSLDMEFKSLENGQFVCKQVREFAGH